MLRVVHLDLKGAPLKVSYLEQFILTAKKWGITGILLEWEDTFPYTRDLVDIGSETNSGGDNLYTMAEVLHILNFIKDNKMIPIQLVQTIGHMEFVLKHDAFRDLREIPHSPAVLCPMKTRSQLLVREMINQALSVQPDAMFFHIGADEVWHSGICADCQAYAQAHRHKTPALFLDHIKNLVMYIKDMRPDITILMWDDMLRALDVTILSDYGLGELVVPVVWNYHAMEHFYFSQELMTRYAQTFPKLWFATAFKGANKSCQIIPQSKEYESNHQAWVAHIQTNFQRNRYYGFIMTGWSRFDHYATLCELLPLAMPSLSNCLKILTAADDGRHIQTMAAAPWPEGNYQYNQAMTVDDAAMQAAPLREWPGQELARCVHSCVQLRDRCLTLLSSDIVNTWLNPWQISRRFTVPGHVEGIALSAEQLVSELTASHAQVTTLLQEVTGERSTEEWVKTYIEPIISKITRLGQIARERAMAGASVKPIAQVPALQE